MQYHKVKKEKKRRKGGKEEGWKGRRKEKKEGEENLTYNLILITVSYGETCGM